MEQETLASSAPAASTSAAASAPAAVTTPQISVNASSSAQESDSAQVPSTVANGVATPIATPAPQIGAMTPLPPQPPAKAPARASPAPTPVERPQLQLPSSQPSPIFAKSSGPLSTPIHRPAEKSPRPPAPTLSHSNVSPSGQHSHTPQFGGPLTTLPHFGVPITSAPQFNGPAVASPSYNNGPITTTPQFGGPSAAQRGNPMSMSSLLSQESAATPAASSAASSSATPRITSGPSQPVVTVSPYTSMAPERHEGWSFAKPQPRQIDAGGLPPKQQQVIPPEPQNRQKFQTFERRRQSSEGGHTEGRERYGDALMRDMEAQHRRKMSFGDHTREREQQRPPAMPSGSSLYQPYPPPTHRQESFFQGQRPPEPPQHHHHHHHGSSHSQRRPAEQASTPGFAPSAQNAWNKAFASPQPWPPSGMPPRPNEEKAVPSPGPSSARKRKASDWNDGYEGQAPAGREMPPSHEQQIPPAPVAAPQPQQQQQQQQQPAAPVKPPSPPIEKRPAGPLFTSVDLDRVSAKPKFMQISSSKVKEALETVKEPTLLGAFTWDPEVDTSLLLDAKTLQKGVGHRVKVLIDGRWLKGAGKIIVEDPQAAAVEDTKPSVDAETPTKTIASDWTVWDLEPLQRRRVWGTDIYTDDSDVLAMCLHSGWIRFGSAVPSIADNASLDSQLPAALEVTLRIVPQLVRYQSSMRNGLKSRSWGNSHDGVSLQVETVKIVETSISKATRQILRETKRKKRTAGAGLTRFDLHGSQGRLVRLDSRGEAHTPYSAELAARLARALLTAPLHSIKQGEDEEMKDVNGEEEAAEPQDFRLSMLGFTVLLCEGALKHELTASSDGSYSIGDLTGIKADNLEFSDDSVIARADDFSERAKFSVDRLSWKAPVAIAV